MKDGKTPGFGEISTELLKLLNQGQIIKGYVEYPAILKGVLSSSANQNDYTVLKSF